jgi:hypothetical protein
MPFGGGILAGAVAMIIILFATGWVVTSGSAKQDVREAKFEQLANICVARVQAHLKETPQTEKLAGYDKREARELLARDYLVTAGLKVSPEMLDDLVDACAEEIA